MNWTVVASVGVFILFIVNIFITLFSSARRETKADNKDLLNHMHGLEGRMHGLEGRMHGVEDRIQGLEGRIQGLESRIHGLEDRMHGLEVGFAEIKVELRHIIDLVTNIQSRQTNMEKEIEALKAYNDEKKLQFNLFEAHRHTHAHLAIENPEAQEEQARG